MTLRTLVSFLCLSIALVILWQFRQILLLLFTAMVLAIALNSLIRFIQRRLGWPRSRSLLAAIAIVAIAGLLILAVVLPPFATQFQELLTLLPQGFDALLDWLDQITTNPPPWIPQDLELPDFPSVIQQLGGVSSRVFGNFITFFSSSVAIMLQLLLVTVITLMLAADPLAYRKLLIRLFPSSYRRRADGIFDKCETALLGWLGGVSLSSLFVALFSFAGLLILRVDFAFAHAVLAGVFNFIPNIGPALSAVFPLGVALSNSIGSAIAVVVLYIIIQNLESYVLQPTIMKHQVSLLPAATLVSQLFFATFFGPVGLVLALPLTVVSRVWIEEAWIKDYLDDTSIAEDGTNPSSAAKPMTQTNSPDQTLGQETSQTVRKDTPSSLSE
ncbi:MAG: AI-2E family transporter [Cyanobacteria bacterium P01_A01_bin.123]